MCLALNIQGINPGINSRSSWKINVLKEEILKIENNKIKIPFIAICESWLKPYVMDTQLDIKGFEVFRSDRKHSKNGGVLLYINDEICVDVMKSYDDDTCNGIVCLSKNSNSIIICVYRPPSASKDSFLNLLKFINDLFFSHNELNKYNVTIFGDFNFPKITWNEIQNNNSKNTTNGGSELVSFAENHFLTQCVDKCTRKTNVLDLIFSDQPNSIQYIQTLDISLSDHYLLKIYNTCFPILNYKPTKTQTSTTNTTTHPYSSLPDFFEINLGSSDFTKINMELSQTKWNEMISQDFENFPENFSRHVFRILSKYSKLKSKKRKSASQRKINIINRKMRKLRKRLKILNINSNEKNTIKKKLEHFLIAKKDLIFQEKLNDENKAREKIKSDSKYFFKFANRFRKTSSAPKLILDENDNIITDNNKIANKFQEYFKTVFNTPVESEINKEYLVNYEIKHPFPEDPFTINDIITAINEIKSTSSCPSYCIPAKVFKECKQTLCIPLCIFWNESYKNGTIPKFYKTQITIPLHKKGPKTKTSNFRPIALTPHEVKIIERVQRYKLNNFLEDNNIINHNQHGFRKNRSCTTQILSYVNYILSNAVNKNETDCIYVDYEKAFDKIDHKILILKLEQIQVSKKFITWTKNFLQDRTQIVYINGSYSYPVKVESGVPQGSVLAPFYFAIFINDLPNFLTNCKTLTFADDTKLVSKIDCIQDQINLQNELNNLNKWTKLNNMRLNNYKFEYISYKLDLNTKTQLLLKELPFYDEYRTYFSSETNVISYSSVIRDLGIYIDSELNWDQHRITICKKAKKLSGWIFNTFFTRDKYTMRILFISLIRPILEYGCEIWSPYKIKDILMIEHIQRNFTSRITGISDLTYPERIKTLNLLSLQRRREKLTILHTWKIKNNVYPNSTDLKFKSDRRTGADRAMIRPLPKVNSKLITKFDGSFLVNSARLWNKLPPKLTTIADYNKFKTGLNLHISKLPDNPPFPDYPSMNHNSILDFSPSDYTI